VHFEAIYFSRNEYRQVERFSDIRA
jgi:hypothetical protein